MVCNEQKRNRTSILGPYLCLYTWFSSQGPELVAIRSPPRCRGQGLEGHKEGGQGWSAVAGMGTAHSTILDKDTLGEKVKSKMPNAEGAGKLLQPGEQWEQEGRADGTQGSSRGVASQSRPLLQGTLGSAAAAERVGEGENVWTLLSMFGVNLRVPQS